MERVTSNVIDGIIVTPDEGLPRHGSPQDRGSADRYYGRGFNPHYYLGDTMQSEKIERNRMTVDEIAAYRYGYDNEEDRKDWG